MILIKSRSTKVLFSHC